MAAIALSGGYVCCCCCCCCWSVLFSCSCTSIFLWQGNVFAALLNSLSEWCWNFGEWQILVFGGVGMDGSGSRWHWSASKVARTERGGIGNWSHPHFHRRRRTYVTWVGRPPPHVLPGRRLSEANKLIEFVVFFCFVFFGGILRLFPNSWDTPRWDYGFIWIKRGESLVVFSFDKRFGREGSMGNVDVGRRRLEIS